MRAEIVHDDNGPRRKRWYQTLGHIGFEREPIHGAVKHHRGDGPGEGQTGDQGRGVPVSLGRIGVGALPLAGPRVRAGHVRLCAGFVEEDEARRINARDLLFPEAALLSDIGPALFRGTHGLFLA